MKLKIALIVGLFLAVAAAAVGWSALTYFVSNADRYRPMIEKNLAAALGNPVRIGGLQMAWSGGLAAEARDLAVFEDGRGVIRVRKAAMKLDPWALLSKKLVIRSIEIVEPKAELTRKSDGSLEVAGVKPADASKNAASAAKSKANSGGSPDSGSWSLLIQDVRIRDGQLMFTDESSKPARTATVRHLDAEVRNVSMKGPVSFSVKAAVLGSEKNFEASGVVVDLGSGRPAVKNVEIKSFLDAIEPIQLAQLAPEVVPVIDGPIEGRLTVRVPEGRLGPESPEWKASAELEKGSARLRNLRPKIDRLDLKLSSTPEALGLESAVVELAGGSVEAHGSVTGYRDPGSARSRLDASARGLKIENFLERDKTAKALLEGAFGGGFEGTAAGTDVLAIRRSLNGKLVLDFPEGIVLNLNLVREIFGKLGTLFPGLLEEAETRLPQSYRTQLTSRSTILKPLHHEFKFENGSVQAEDITVSTDFFSVALSGRLSPDNEFEGKGTIRLDEAFSNAVFEATPALGALANAARQAEIPIRIVFRSGRLSILPDVEDIGRRLIRQPGKKILSQLLSGLTSDAGASGPEEAADGKSAP